MYCIMTYSICVIMYIAVLECIDIIKSIYNMVILYVHHIVD
jgi:hypothetical protein